jgi:hypothetical protein
MKHLTPISQQPRKAEIPLSGIIQAISAVLGVVAGLLEGKEATS